MEHNIIVLKPDENSQQEFSSLVRGDLIENGFEIISVISRRLTAEEFRANFISKDLQHEEYMTESSVVAILYAGYSAIKFARVYKGKIRRRFKCSQLRNILHSTEPGNEYESQFSLFFQDLVRGNHRQFSDQGVLYDGSDDLKKGLSRLVRHIPICKPDELSRMREKLEGSGKVGFYGVLAKTRKSYDIVRYFAATNRGTCSKGKFVNALVIKDLSFYQEMIDTCVRDHNIQALVTYMPGLTILETEKLRTEAFAHQLFCIGGTFGLAKAGSICGSREMHEILESHL